MLQYNNEHVLNQINTHNYNKLLYPSRPIAFNDYINDKPNIVHNELYQDALKQCIDNLIETNISRKFLYQVLRYINSVMFYDTDNIDTLIECYLNSLKDDLEGIEDINNALNNLELNYDEYMDFVFRNIFNKLFYLLSIVKSTDNENIYNDFIAKLLYVYHIQEEQEDYIYMSETISNDNIYNINNGNYLFLLEESQKETILLTFNENAYWYLELHPTVNDSHIYDIEDDNKELEYMKDILNKTDEFEHNIKYYIDLYNKTLLSELQAEAKRIYLNDHNFIEIKNDEYHKPSKVNVLSKRYIHKHNKLDLTPFWNTIQYKNEYNIDSIKENNDNVNKMYEIIYIDYINKKVKLESRLTGETKYVSFDYVNENIPINDKYDNTFTNLMYNNLNNNNIQ